MQLRREILKWTETDKVKIKKWQVSIGQLEKQNKTKQEILVWERATDINVG